MSNDVEKRLNQFKKDLSVLTSIQIVRKHIVSGDCFILSQDEYFDLRSEVAEHFGLHPNEVLVVGSAKLGFSVAPNSRYREFCDESDIDVAMVSSMLFEQFGKMYLIIGMKVHIGLNKDNLLIISFEDG